MSAMQMNFTQTAKKRFYDTAFVDPGRGVDVRQTKMLQVNALSQAFIMRP